MGREEGNGGTQWVWVEGCEVDRRFRVVGRGIGGFRSYSSGKVQSSTEVDSC